jgi:hypothetical protein
MCIALHCLYDSARRRISPRPVQLYIARQFIGIFSFRQELFMEHGGPIKRAEVFYKQDGSSSGQAVRDAEFRSSPFFLPPSHSHLQRASMRRREPRR